MSTRDGLREALRNCVAQMKHASDLLEFMPDDYAECIRLSEAALAADAASEQASPTVREQLNQMFGKDKVDYAIAEAAQPATEKQKEVMPMNFRDNLTIPKSTPQPGEHRAGEQRTSVEAPDPAAEAGTSFDALTWLKKEWPYDWATFNVRQLRAIEEVYAVGYQAAKDAAAPGLSREAVRDALRNFASEPGTDGDWCACVDISEDSEDLPKLLRLLRSFEAQDRG